MGFLFSKPKKEKTNIKNETVNIDKQDVENLIIKDKTVNIDKQDCKIILTFSSNFLARQWTNYLINKFTEAQAISEKCIDEHFDINIDGKKVIFSIDKNVNCKNSQFVFNNCKKYFNEITSNSKIVINDTIYNKIRLTKPPNIKIIKKYIDDLKKYVKDLTGGKNKYTRNKQKYLHLLNQNRF
jgi:hypothetical protein